MPVIADLNDLFADMLKDIYYAEKKILKTLPKLAKAVGKDSPLAAAFEKHRQETEGQVKRLEQVFGIIDQKPKAKKCDAIEGILKEGDALIKEVDCKATLRAGLLAGAQAVEHYEIARYGTLVEWAKRLGRQDAAELLEETLEQEKNTDSSLNEMAVKEINQAAVDALDEDEEEEEKKPRTPSRRRAA